LRSLHRERNRACEYSGTISDNQLSGADGQVSGIAITDCGGGQVGENRQISSWISSYTSTNEFY
jgi:hypothetical protein